jgi:hypothetical protein
MAWTHLPWPPPPLWCLGGGARCNPSQLYKGPPGRDENTQKWATCSPLLSLVCPLQPSLLSLSCGLSKGCVGARLHHRCMSSCCRVSGISLKPSTSAISAGSGVIVITVRVWICGGAASCATGVVAPSSSTTLRLATSASSSTLVRERNPHVRSTRVCHRNTSLPLQLY